MFKGGEAYLYKPLDGSQSHDWRSDCHRWYNKIRMYMSRKNPRVAKAYFYLVTKEGINKEFRKCMYLILTVHMVHIPYIIWVMKLHLYQELPNSNKVDIFCWKRHIDISPY